MRACIWCRMILLLITLVIGCTGKEKEEKAQVIFQHAQRLEREGRILEALREYDRLVNYKKTKTLKAAKAHLLDDGISIGQCVESWSIKQMFKVKNRLIKRGETRHPDGNVVVPLSTKDGWGSHLRVEYSTGPKFIFNVLSGGPDKKLGTDDDLSLYHQISTQGRALSSAGKGAGSQSRKSSHRTDKTVELNDLLQTKPR